jgi:hypothetical protein
MSARSLEFSLGISKTEINAAIKRSISLGLAIKDRASDRARSNRRDLCNFIIYGLKFVFRQSPAP